jgi:Mn-dependent DtxR family transcriptional regulator
LLNLLERPKQGRTLAKELGVTLQGVLHILRKLFVQGHVKFGDPKTLSWWVMRAEDETSLLSREEEVVLSAIPGAYATDVLKIAHRARLAEDRVETVLERLAASGFVEPAGEFNGAALFRATAAGLGHPQKRPNTPDAEPPRLPVYSKRVRAVLASIENAGALRIKDVRDRMGLAKKSTNALMQYLKRRGLVEKTGENFEDPYALTVMGRLTLAEMTHPGQMQFGYSPVAVDTVVAARRAKPAGVSRPPRASKVPAVKPPPLGPHSDRVQAVLSVISNAGALRIKDVSDRLRLPAQSTNALMQYLKRKGLVQKAGEQPGAPYGLTTMGRDKLTDLTQRRAA